MAVLSELRHGDAQGPSLGCQGLMGWLLTCQDSLTLKDCHWVSGLRDFQGPSLGIMPRS